jgi:CMP-N-acetylneuraminic acid synthetase
LCWYQGKPLNYSLTEPTPKPQDIPPVIFEQSSLYVFSKASYIKNRKRIGDTPFIKYVDHFEGHEISIDEDFKIAELIVNSGMYTEL